MHRCVFTIKHENVYTNHVPPHMQLTSCRMHAHTSQAVLCPFELHGACNDPECPHLHLSSSSPSSPPRRAATTTTDASGAWRSLALPLPPFRHPLLAGDGGSGDDVGPSSVPQCKRAGAGAGAAAAVESKEEGQQEVAVLLNASSAAAAAAAAASPPPMLPLSQGRKSFAEQGDFVPLVSMAEGSDDEGQEDSAAAAAAMDESSNGSGGGADEVERKGEAESGAAARYFAAADAEPQPPPPSSAQSAAAAAAPPPTSEELEAPVQANPLDAEAWLALAARRLLLSTAANGGPEEGEKEEDEAGVVKAALQALGAATEPAALVTWLVRLGAEEQGGGGGGGACPPEALRSALRVLARALDALPPGSEAAAGPWLLYLRLYTALPSGGPLPPRAPASLLEGAHVAGAAPPAASPVGPLSPSIAGKADALLEAARDHSPGSLPLWRAAEAYHRLCRVPTEAGAEAGAEGPLLARALRFHSEALAALPLAQPSARSSAAAPAVACLLLQRALCLLHAGHGAEAVRTLAVPLGALAQHADLAGCLLPHDGDEQQLLQPALPPAAPWRAVLSASPPLALLLWAALLHLTAFGCLPPAALDLLPTPTPPAAFALLAWHPADARPLAGNTSVRAVAAAFRSWAEEAQEELEEGGAMLRAVLGWNLVVLSLGPPSEAPAPVAAAGLPAWVVWGLGRLSTLRPALRLAAAAHGWAGPSLWRHIMTSEGEGGGCLFRVPAPELAAARLGLLVARLDPDNAAMGLEEDNGEGQEGALILTRDALLRLLGRGPAATTSSSSSAAAAASSATLPARSLQEEVVALGEALLKALSKDAASTAGARALAALLLARLRLHCGGGAGGLGMGLGTAVAGLRQHLLTTSGGAGEGALERAALWLELLGLLRQRWRQQGAEAEAAKDKGGGGDGGDGGGNASMRQQVESAVTAAVRDLMTVAAAPNTTYGAAVLWALDGRPRCRGMGALAVQALVEGVLGLPRWGEWGDSSSDSSSSMGPHLLPLLERCLLPLCAPSPASPMPLTSGALVALSHAILAQSLGRPSRAGSLLRLRAALHPRLIQRLEGARGAAWAVEEGEAGAAVVVEGLCLAQAELALQEPDQAQLALERGLVLDPVAAGPWTALLQLEACFGGGGGGGGGGAGDARRLACVVEGLRAAGVDAPLLL